MSEPLEERLSRFTPDGTGLDRDALLFAAGRASVRPPRGWMAVAGTLAATQLLTLVFLWPRQTPSAVDSYVVSSPSGVQPAPTSGPEPVPLWGLRAQMLVTEGEAPAPAPVESLISDDPPLRAFAAPPVALLN